LLNDFAPIAWIANGTPLIVSKNSIPAANLMELIAWLKANPGNGLQGTAGVGSPQHVAGVYFQNETGTRFQFIPYRAVAPAMQDLIAGNIDFMIDQATNSLPCKCAHVRYGLNSEMTANPRRVRFTLESGHPAEAQ
jgi:tripartite-type tricarboxylate transporter receptor subunit TctC